MNVIKQSMLAILIKFTFLFTNYAFSIEGSENLISKLELKKNINGFNLSFNVKDNLTNQDNREANIAQYFYL